MTTLPSLPRRWSLPARFVGGVVATLVAGLALFWLVMNPPMGDLALMTAFLSITALGSILAGYAAYKLRWLQKAPGLRWAIFGTCALSSALTFFNVWLTARLMFANEHDLQLATVLLIFASGIAMVAAARRGLPIMMRSEPSSDLAIVQPWFSPPTRLAISGVELSIW